MKKNLEVENKELQKELNELQEELKEFKNVISLYLDKYVFDIDNITPEDLEYSLLSFERDKLDSVGFADLSEQGINAYRWREVFLLYQIFNPEAVSYINPQNSLKAFIKSLVRNNTVLMNENEVLKMLL